jgi:O-antigen ligase
VGSRVVSGPGTNAQILDDQLLTTLLEVGMLGVLGVVVLFWYPILRLWKFSRSPSTPARFTDLAVALLTTMVGYFFSLFFFDGFGFTQTVMVFAVLLAMGGWLITEVPWTKKPHRKRAAVPTPAVPVET